MNKTFDYIIVGCGLAGIAFCEQLRKQQKTFIVFDNSSQHSSIVAGGLYNPVVLKRFTSVWKSKEQLKLVQSYYKDLENILKTKLDYKISVLRRFTSSEEQNNWFVAADKPQLEEYMSLSIIKNVNNAIKAPYGFGEVLQSGRVDTSLLVKSYRLFLKSKNVLDESEFYYNNLKINLDNSVVYNNINAKHIIFSEGFGIKSNPYFNYLPLKGTKGELITIYAPQLQTKKIIKSGVFIIPLGESLYRVGATYNWEDKSNTATKAGRDELILKLKKILNCNFEVINQSAGIRPTVIDRRPLVGRHYNYESVFILNGLGTRGVMIAPYISDKLFNYIENNVPLDSEIDIKRFKV